MKIIWFGTATISISHEERSILFDPFLPMNGVPPSKSISELATRRDIFLTHSHCDHLMHAAQVIQSGSSRVYCSETGAANDSFPPVSNTINTSSFIRSVAATYPGLLVFVPEYKEVIFI